LYSTSYLAAEMRSERASEPSSDSDEAQYHRDPRVQLALALGAIYVVFLACWVWATRVRPRRR
jgi:uncharacterized BrkB/YihY/UPF0761 family membrane protein